MEFHFIWKTTELGGELTGIFEQTIFAGCSSHAFDIFTSFHGEVGPDSDGCVLEITSIKLVN